MPKDPDTPLDPANYNNDAQAIKKMMEENTYTQEMKDAGVPRAPGIDQMIQKAIELTKEGKTQVPEPTVIKSGSPEAFLNKTNLAVTVNSAILTPIFERDRISLT